MSDRPYVNTPTAVLLREMHASGMSWPKISARLGYNRITLWRCSTGRSQAGPGLARDVAELHAQRAKVAA